MPEAHWPAGIAKSVSSGFSERPYLQHYSVGSWEKTPGINLWPLHGHGYKHTFLYNTHVQRAQSWGPEGWMGTHISYSSEVFSSLPQGWEIIYSSVNSLKFRGLSQKELASPSP